MANPVITAYSPDYATSPPRGCYVVTPSDSVDLPIGKAKGLYLSGAATVKVTFEDGSSATLPLPAGGNQMIITRVWATPAPGVSIWAFV